MGVHVRTRKAPASEKTPAEKDYVRKLEQMNKELLEANRELEEFAFVASHDLREPLRMVTVYTQLLVSRYQHAFDEQGLEFAHQIEYSANRLEQLIQDLVQYSTVSNPASELPVPTADVRKALDQAVAALRERLDLSCAKIEIGALPTAQFDLDQLAVVFQNLLSNSLKYADARRPIRIRVWAEPAGSNAWTVNFADNGIGFEPKYAERIFGLFTRLHGRSIPGTGLGLAICRRLIERYGGNMWADGTAESGSTFLFTLKGHLQSRAENHPRSFGGGQSR